MHACIFTLIFHNETKYVGFYLSSSSLLFLPPLSLDLFLPLYNPISTFIFICNIYVCILYAIYMCVYINTYLFLSLDSSNKKKRYSPFFACFFFTWCDSLQFHLSSYKVHNFTLQVNKISLCGCATFCLSAHLWMGIQTSLILTLVDNTAINTTVQASL